MMSIVLYHVSRGLAFPRPAQRGEGGEASKRSEDGEPGEGTFRFRGGTSPASRSLGTLSPFYGERGIAVGALRNNMRARFN
jgi:hypothetical protein